MKIYKYTYMQIIQNQTKNLRFQLYIYFCVVTDENIVFVMNQKNPFNFISHPPNCVLNFLWQTVI